jgi:hypothetical protein
MSEVDRLSNSGIYPALPIADKRSRKDGSSQQPPPEKPPSVAPEAGGSQDSKTPRPPKSIIDEYA